MAEQQLSGCAIITGGAGGIGATTARAVLHLATEQGGHVTGTDLVVDGGRAAGVVAPRRAHRPCRVRSRLGRSSTSPVVIAATKV